MPSLALHVYAATSPVADAGGYLGQALGFVGIVNWRSWLPLGIAGVIVWSLWIYRWILSRSYQPTVNSSIGMMPADEASKEKTATTMSGA